MRDFKSSRNRVQDWGGGAVWWMPVNLAVTEERAFEGGWLARWGRMTVLW